MKGRVAAHVLIFARYVIFFANLIFIRFKCLKKKKKNIIELMKKFNFKIFKQALFLHLKFYHIDINNIIINY